MPLARRSITAQEKPMPRVVIGGDGSRMVLTPTDHRTVTVLAYDRAGTLRETVMFERDPMCPGAFRNTVKGRFTFLSDIHAPVLARGLGAAFEDMDRTQARKKRRLLFRTHAVQRPME